MIYEEGLQRHCELWRPCQTHLEAMVVAALPPRHWPLRCRHVDASPQRHWAIHTETGPPPNMYMHIYTQTHTKSHRRDVLQCHKHMPQGPTQNLFSSDTSEVTSSLSFLTTLLQLSYTPPINLCRTPTIKCRVKIVLWNCKYQGTEHSATRQEQLHWLSLWCAW